MGRKTSWCRFFAVVAIAAGLAGLLLFSSIPNFVSPPCRKTSPLHACPNNLRQLDGAAEQWRLENGLSTNAIPTVADVSVHMNGEPVCPSGGGYRFLQDNGLPTCSVVEHARTFSRTSTRSPSKPTFSP
jgi:hypothetical protein